MSKKRRVDNYPDLGCECVHGVSKELFTKLISSYDDLEESKEFFGTLNFNSRKYTLPRKNPDYLYNSMQATSKISIDTTNDCIIWEWDITTLEKLKDIIGLSNRAKLKFYVACSHIVKSMCCKK